MSYDGFIGCITIIARIQLQQAGHYSTLDLLLAQESNAIASPVVSIDMGSFDTQKTLNQRNLLAVVRLDGRYLKEGAYSPYQKNDTNK